MRRWWWFVAIAFAGCGFAATLPGGGAEETVTLVDDSAAELAGGTLVDGVITPAGVIEPAAFVRGGLHARGFLADLVDDADTYEDVVAETVALAETGAGYRQVPTTWLADRPRGLGLTSSANFTVLYDGEILLPAGTLQLEANVSERAIVQVALDGTTFGERLFAHNAVGTITLVVPAAGWYPLRAAYSDAGGDANLVLTIVQGQERTAVGADRLRARVTDAPGLVVFGFDGQGFVVDRGETARPTIDDAFGTFAPPWDLGQSFDRFSLRYAGQLRIDTAGAYTFSAELGIDQDDGFRLWIDGEPRAQRWAGLPVALSAVVDLEAGWHDLVVDYADNLGNAELELRMQGPDAPEGSPIAPARLRPAVKHGNTMTFFETAATTIADQGMTSVDLPLPGTATTVIDAVDYGFQIDNQQMTALAVELVDCNGARALPVLDAPGYHYFAADRSCRGTPTTPASPWRLRLTDSIAGNTPFVGDGAIRAFGIFALYHGGDRMPFATTIRYESAIEATPGARRIARVRATGTLDGAALELAVRTGTDEAAVAAAPWTVVTETSGPIEASELAQYRVVITTDGWQYPRLDNVEIAYVVDVVDR